MNNVSTHAPRRLHRKHSFDNLDKRSLRKAHPPTARAATNSDLVRKKPIRKALDLGTRNDRGLVRRLRQPGTVETSQRDGPSAPITIEDSQRITRNPSQGITHTIEQLETLLDEAVQVAQAAAQIEAETPRAPSAPQIKRREEEAPPTITPRVPGYFPDSNEHLPRCATSKTAQAQGVTASIAPATSDLEARLQQVRNALRAGSASSDDSERDVTKPLTSSATTMPSTSRTNPANTRTPNAIRWAIPDTSPKGTNTVSSKRHISFAPAPHEIGRPSVDDDREWESMAAPRPEPVPALQVRKEEAEDKAIGGESDTGHHFDARNSFVSPGLDDRDHFTQMFGISSRHESIRLAHPEFSRDFDLKKRKQTDFPLDMDDLDSHETCGHAPVARDWSSGRKRLCAVAACINTSCIGLLLGIYAGEVPAIQYVIIDLDHSVILGNVVFYLALMLSTLFLWPLPLLHGRKPYLICGLMFAICLQVPQGIAVIKVRLPSQTAYRVLLLLSRALSGFALGLCDINLIATLLDLFGASLQSRNPHQEVADVFDVRRHGGGMGLWLGIWSWCSIGPLSIGFMIGAFIISHASVDWGFWVSQLILAIVLVINVVSPEVRRSAFRRTVEELIGPRGEFGRIARGEIKMHLKAEGPSWWGEEVAAGYELVRMMSRQFGFLVLTTYTAWVYAQFVLVLILIGSLASTVYRFKPIPVGLCALSLALGALLATPFQKASWISRARSHRTRTDSMTLQHKVSWTSHLARRTLFTMALPVFGVAFTVTSYGPPLPVALPCVMAGAVGFFSGLAIAECCGILFETFDTSDLQPGMTGRPARFSVVQRYRNQRTNFSCYPRIMAGISITQALKFGLAAAATGVTGRVTRSIGVMHTMAVVAGILFGLTVLLTVVLIRWHTVQMIPDSQMRRDGSIWEPVILGRPSGTMRRLSILEVGKMTRWSEIRRKNRLTSSFSEGYWS